MTRFARAKGSKASNEKKPEEATSWQEMKKGMLVNPTKKSERYSRVPEEEEYEKDDTDLPNPTEWASLGNDGKDNCLLKNLKKPKQKSDINEIVKKKKKVKKETQNVNSEESPVKKKKKKKMKLQSESVQEPESKTQKKSKKRKLADDTAEVVENKKQKKEKKKKDANEKEQKVVTNTKKKKKSKKKKLQSNENESVSSELKPQKKNVQSPESTSKKKKVKNKEFKYDKTVLEELIVNGKTIPIVKFQGFNVMQEDAERLKDLRNEMIKQGIPKDKLEAALKLERRRAEKALSRLKKAVCFHCRGIGHLLSDCPDLKEKENTGTGICYKCGSTEHLSSECKVIKGTNFAFAECFICKEQGHIARQCPDNPRGLYPQGGACRECGDVTHLRKDCPQGKKAEEILTVGRRTDENLECLDEEIVSREKEKVKKVKKKSAVKF